MAGPELKVAIDIADRAQASGADPGAVAVALILLATRYLVQAGSAQATAHTLDHIAGRVRSGQFPEYQHPAGHA